MPSPLFGMETDPEFSHSGNPRLGQRLYVGFPVLSDPVLKITQAHLSRTRNQKLPVSSVLAEDSVVKSWLVAAQIHSHLCVRATVICLLSRVLYKNSKLAISSEMNASSLFLSVDVNRKIALPEVLRISIN